MPKRILIINPFGVGDVLFSTVLVSSIEKIYPKGYIGYICNIRTKEILETNSSVDEIFVFERDEYRRLFRLSKIQCVKKFFSFWRNIQKRHFDIVFDLSLGKEYAFLCWLVGIKERRGFNYKGRGRFLTHKMSFDGFNDKSVAEYYLDLVPSPHRGEGKGEGIETVLVPTESDRAYINNFLRECGLKEDDFLIGIAPGGGVSFGPKNQDKRRWSTKKFSELADKLVERFNARVVLIWGPGEENLVRDIASLMAKPSLIAPKTSIREMAALCTRCKVVVCSEGGPLHIASSQRVTTISIFGPVDEKVYGPYLPSENNIVITSDLECRPCYKRFKLPECQTKKCLEDIPAEIVFEAVRGKL